MPEEYEAARRAGSIVAGSRAAVRAELAEHIAETGINYLLLQLAFGDLAHEQEMRTLELLAAEVMPALAEAG